jgi:hypothetical protein
MDALILDPRIIENPWYHQYQKFRYFLDRDSNALLLQWGAPRDAEAPLRSDPPIPASTSTPDGTDLLRYRTNIFSEKIFPAATGRNVF